MGGCREFFCLTKCVPTYLCIDLTGSYTVLARRSLYSTPLALDIAIELCCAMLVSVVLGVGYDCCMALDILGTMCPSVYVVLCTPYFVLCLCVGIAW